VAPVPDAGCPDRRRADDHRRDPGADRTGPCFTAADGPLQVFLGFLLLAVPLLIGMFWGAPLFLGLSMVLGGFCFWWIRRPVN
jgi:hypothetical protein